ncbi:hypothetical protein EDD37DRAFT_457979 [Exophiala viscosa]|uniref:uncharacterized protein n=1 Tax=Exophiala viscosa TaxID=2486360 RepID=UPI002192A329|nr:hypothetical protein EDD37DRAFT_457979 [Exophiala viscosa]
MRIFKLLLLSFAIFSPNILSASHPWRRYDPCPSSISAKIPGTCNGHPQFETMSDVHHALLSCPNITALDLRIAVPGCSDWTDRLNLPLSLHGGKCYPPLRSLTLGTYYFSGRPVDETQWERPGLTWYERALEWALSGPASFKRLSYLHLPQLQREKTNLDLWLDAMDFGKLENLALSAGRSSVDDKFFLNKMATHLTGLKRLLLNHETERSDETFTFLHNLNSSLTHLTLTNIWDTESNTNILTPIVATHGDSLQYLDIHSFEPNVELSPVFSPQQLIDSLPRLLNLSHLALNIARNGTWPLETFAAIASSTSHLTSLDLWLNIASECRHQKPDLPPWHPKHSPTQGTCTGAEQFLLPYVNETTALKVFEFLRQHKAGSVLQNVTFWVGDWTRPWAGPHVPSWIEGRKALVRCTSEADPDGRGQCHVEVGERYWERGDQDARDWAYIEGQLARLAEPKR